MFCFCIKSKQKSNDKKVLNLNSVAQQPPTQSLSNLQESVPQNQIQRPPLAPRARPINQESQNQNQQNRTINNRQEQSNQNQVINEEPEQRRSIMSQENQKIAGAKPQILVISNATKDQIETREMTPTKSQKTFFKYACPICWKYLNIILQTQCCKNYICHFCIDDFISKKISTCPHCNFQGMKLTDVNQNDQVRIYSDSMAGSSNKIMQQNTAQRLSKIGQNLKNKVEEDKEDEDSGDFERDNKEVILNNSLLPKGNQLNNFSNSTGFQDQNQLNVIQQQPFEQEMRKSF